MRRSISIIIPAYNEEKRLPSTLKMVKAYLDRTPWDFCEIVVVDDGSRDGTVGVAECRRRAGAAQSRQSRQGLHRAARHAGGQGRVGAVHRCRSFRRRSRNWRSCGTRWSASGAQVAIGSRALDRSLVGVHQPPFREIMGRVFNLVMRLVTGLPFHDTQCGFKLFQTGAAREIFRRQLLDGFGFDVEVLFIAKRLGYRTLEVPVRWNDVAGTKVSLMRGVVAFLDPLKVRWNGIDGEVPVERGLGVWGWGISGGLR